MLHTCWMVWEAFVLEQKYISLCTMSRLLYKCKEALTTSYSSSLLFWFSFSMWAIYKAVFYLSIFGFGFVSFTGLVESARQNEMSDLIELTKHGLRWTANGDPDTSKGVLLLLLVLGSKQPSIFMTLLFSWEETMHLRGQVGVKVQGFERTYAAQERFLWCKQCRHICNRYPVAHAPSLYTKKKKYAC